MGPYVEFVVDLVPCLRIGIDAADTNGPYNTASSRGSAPASIAQHLRMSCADHLDARSGISSTEMPTRNRYRGRRPETARQFAERDPRGSLHRSRVRFGVGASRAGLERAGWRGASSRFDCVFVARIAQRQ